MTLNEARRQLSALLDETDPPAELSARLDLLLDMGQQEVALHYPIWKTQAYDGGAPRALPQDCLRPCQLIADGAARPCPFDAPLPQGAFTLLYQARPAPIPAGAPGDTPLSLPDEAVPAAVLYAAAQSQAMEYDQRFFQSFYAQYQGRLANLAAAAPGPAAVVEVAADECV